MRRCALAVIAAASIGFSFSSRAGQAWLEVGDSRLRDDLQLLADAGVVSLPLTGWPIPVADIERVLADAQVDLDSPLAETYDAALGRLRRAIKPEFDGSPHVDLIRVNAGNAGLLRDFDTAGRSDGELTVGMAALGERWAVELRGTYAAGAADDRSFRLDGSHITGRFGNWLVGAGLLDRWWGPGHVSSMILSNNARPIPSFMLDRATSSAFRTPLLRWLGPWRFTTLVGKMESDRQDVAKPLFMGMRVSFRPSRVLEIGLSRTAQFCGQDRRCGFRTFLDVLGFNDTSGVTVAPEDEPGNQLAGGEIRLSSPWRSIPIALYTQRIGEDRIDYRPTDILVQHGMEAWHVFRGGGVLHAFAEYSDATCAAGSDNPVFNCAYSNSIFFVEGYRYRGRSIGHTTDNDSILRAFGLNWQRKSGQQWTLQLRDASLNRDSGTDVRNTVSAAPGTYQSVELGWRDSVFGGELQVQLGLERLEPQGAAAESDVFGFVSWRTPL